MVWFPRLSCIFLWRFEFVGSGTPLLVFILKLLKVSSKILAYFNEVAELLTRQNNPRLLTLTGAGGSGKTRLALAVAEKLREGSRFAGGIYFIALETITNRPELLNHLVITLKLKDLPGTTQLETLKTYLADRPRLLPPTSPRMCRNCWRRRRMWWC
jgi:hypothetical protein